MAKRDEGKSAYEKHLKKYMEGVLSYIPEDKRAEASAKLEQNEAFYDELGEATMMRSDYSKKLDEVRTAAEGVNKYNASLTDWYSQNQAALTEAARLKEENELLKAGGRGNGGTSREEEDPDPSSTASLKKMQENFIPRAEAQKILEQRLAEQANNSVGLTTSLNKISMQHYANFSEVLDPDAVIQHALKSKKNLDAAYSDLFKDRYEEKAAKALEAKEKETETRIREKVEREFREKNPTLPYQISNSMDGGLSPILEAMKTKEKQAEHGVNAALDEFYRMQRPV